MRRLRHRIADRFIIRATSGPVEEPQPATEVFIDGPLGRLQCFATRKPAGQQHSEHLNLHSSPAGLLILKLPGTAGRAERSTPFPATLFPHIDAEVWTWNPPGYGDSDGAASLRAIPAAIDQVWDHLSQTRRSDNTFALVMGNSLGSATALSLHSRRHVDGVVLRNPPPLRHMVRAGNAWWNAFRGGSWLSHAIDDSMDALLTAKHCHSPALFIQSAKDSLVLPRWQDLIYDAYAGPKHRLEIPDADHDTPYDEDDLPVLREAFTKAFPSLAVITGNG